MGTKIYQCHLTENYQLKAADALISKLKQTIGEQESYITELLDVSKSLEKEKDKWKSKWQIIADKYNKDSQELNKELRETEFIRSLEAERDKWRNLYNQMRESRDSALNTIAKLQNGRDI